MSFDNIMARADEVINANPLSEVEQFREGGIRGAAAEEAAVTEPIQLDSDGFTPGMRDSCIEPAVSSLENWADRRNHVAADLRNLIDDLEREEALPEKKRQRKNQGDEEKEHVRQQRNNDGKVQQVQSEKDELDREYEHLKGRAGREAKEFKPFFYWPGLFVIGCIEWVINYSFFEGNYVPFVAGGFTILVAMVVAFASHYHGILAKQRLELFHEGEKKLKKIDQRLWQLFMFVALLAALAWVGWERYSYIQKIYGEAGLGSETGNGIGIPVETIDPTAKVLQTLIGNVLVWVVGVIWSYINHDHIPNFSETLYRKKRKDAALQKATRKYQKQLDEIDARVRNDMNKIATEHENKMRQLKEAKRKLNRLKKQDNNVVKKAKNLMEQRLKWYHDSLCRDLEKNNEDQTFIKNGERLELSEYRNNPPKIDMESINRIVEG